MTRRPAAKPVCARGERTPLASAMRHGLVQPLWAPGCEGLAGHGVAVFKQWQPLHATGGEQHQG